MSERSDFTASARGAKLKGTDQRKAGARSYLERTAGNE